jgi:hypothetical protein
LQRLASFLIKAQIKHTHKRFLQATIQKITPFPRQAQTVSRCVKTFFVRSLFVLGALVSAVDAIQQLGVVGTIVTLGTTVHTITAATNQHQLA